ncbi:MAG TPA: hypothetical protein VFT13_07870 [Candidatus Krumholzibacteria bacterium]|nr:hypothetical protein [Candidatus Krumholzibacteria bacterium]
MINAQQARFPLVIVIAVPAFSSGCHAGATAMRTQAVGGFKKVLDRRDVNLTAVF